MARVVNFANSWEHRSVYWKTTLSRQFIKDDRVFIYLKNQGISEIFCIGRPFVKIDRFEKAQMNEFRQQETTNSNTSSTARSKSSKVKPRLHSSGDIVLPRKENNKKRLLSATRKSKESVTKKTGPGKMIRYITFKGSDAEKIEDGHSSA